MRWLFTAATLLLSFLHLAQCADREASSLGGRSSLVGSIWAETFYQTFYQTGGKSNAVQTTQQCGQQCKLVASPYEGVVDQLSGPCGCIARQDSCNLDFSSGIVKDLCGQMGNREVNTAFTDWESVAAGAMRKLQGSHESPLLASTECWQDSQSFQAICEVLFEEASRPLLHALRRARSKNINFSHCALSFGNEAPLRSETCFTSNQTDTSGAPFFAVARVASDGSTRAAMPLKFSAHFDDHWEFTTHELIFVTEPSVAKSEQL